MDALPSATFFLSFYGSDIRWHLRQNGWAYLNVEFLKSFDFFKIILPPPTNEETENLVPEPSSPGSYFFPTETSKKLDMLKKEPLTGKKVDPALTP